MSLVYQYNFISGEWIELTALPSARNDHGSVCIGSLLYTIGGVYREDGDIKLWPTVIHVLNVSDLSWTKVSDLKYGVKNPGLAVVDGDIYVTGGVNTDATISRRIVKYRPSTDQWTDRRQMPVNAQSSVASTVAVGKRIYLLGHKDFLCYDTERDNWSILDAPLIPSYWCSMVYRHGKLLAMGGDEGRERLGRSSHDRLQSYDLDSRKWSLLNNTMTVALSFHYSFVVHIPRSS